MFDASNEAPRRAQTNLINCTVINLTIPILIVTFVNFWDTFSGPYHHFLTF
jgi:hypothetical protein